MTESPNYLPRDFTPETDVVGTKITGRVKLKVRNIPNCQSAGHTAATNTEPNFFHSSFINMLSWDMHFSNKTTIWWPRLLCTVIGQVSAGVKVGKFLSFTQLFLSSFYFFSCDRLRLTPWVFQERRCSVIHICGIDGVETTKTKTELLETDQESSRRRMWQQLFSFESFTTDRNTLTVVVVAPKVGQTDSFEERQQQHLA